MATRLTIWSGAFARMTGAKGLRSQALDADGNPTDRNAAGIAGVYPTLVVDCLTVENWPWTIHRFALTRQAAPDHPWRYRHDPPPGRGDPQQQQAQPIIGPGPLSVYDDAQARLETDTEWWPEGLSVYSDAEALWGDYQYRSPEESWPEQFAEYVILRICAETAGSYMSEPGKAAEYMARAREKQQTLIDSANEVLPPQALFTRFSTTDVRYGFYQDRLRRVTGLT